MDGRGNARHHDLVALLIEDQTVNQTKHVNNLEI